MTKETPIVLHNGSSYDYHFIINELVEEFEGQFPCLFVYITFSVPIEKQVTKLDKKRKEITTFLIVQDL